MATGKFDRFMVDVHIGTNRKLRRLSVAERWCHVAGILAVAAQAPIRGRLLIGHQDATPEDYAELAGVTVVVARSAVTKLRDGGVIVPDEENDCEQIHDWDEINPSPRNDRTNTERQQRYRDRRNARVTERYVTPVTRGREVEEKEEAKASSSDALRADREKGKASEEDRRNCRLFAELLKQHNPKAKIKSEAAWLRDMRLCREADAHSPDEIEKLVRWVFTDSGRDARFWADVIQSPGSLREHFAQMWAKMARPVQLVSTVEDSSSFLQRRGAT